MKKLTQDDYRRLHAEAIGVDPDMSEEDQVAAHHEHMALVNQLAAIDDVAGLPPQIAKVMRVTAAPNTTMPNSVQNVGEQITALVNAERAADPKLSQTDAWDRVRWRRPDLFATKTPPIPNGNPERTRKILDLVNANMRAGAGGTGLDAYQNCWDLAKAEHPELFANMIEPAPQK